MKTRIHTLFPDDQSYAKLRASGTKQVFVQSMSVMGAGTARPASDGSHAKLRTSGTKQVFVQSMSVMDAGTARLAL